MPKLNVDATLIPQLIAAFSAHPKDVVTLARVERSARGVAKRNPLLGAILLGACAAAKGNAAASRRHHEAALRMAPRDLSSWTNYMVSLSILGDVETARAKAFEMGERFRGNPTAIRCALNTLGELGLLQSAAKFRRIHGQGKGPDDEAAAWANVVDNVLHAHRLDERQLAEVVLASRDFLAGQGLVRAGITCEFHDDDVGGPGSLVYGFVPRTGSDAAHALEGRLFAFLADRRFPAETCGAIDVFIGFTEDGEAPHASATH